MLFINPAKIMYACLLMQVVIVRDLMPQASMSNLLNQEHVICSSNMHLSIIQSRLTNLGTQVLTTPTKCQTLDRQYIVTPALLIKGLPVGRYMTIM